MAPPALHSGLRALQPHAKHTVHPLCRICCAIAGASLRSYLSDGWACSAGMGWRAADYQGPKAGDPALSVVVILVAQEEAKDAFKELLVAVQVGSDWSWDKCMRTIISDPRC